MKWISHVCMLSCFGRVQLFASLWTIVHQAPLSMGFSRQEYWSGLPCPPPGDLPDPGIEPTSPMSPVLAGGFFTASANWEAGNSCVHTYVLSLLDLPPTPGSPLTPAHIPPSRSSQSTGLSSLCVQQYPPSDLFYCGRARLPVQEMRVQSLGREDPLEREMATHSSILAWRFPWTEEPGGLHPWGPRRVRHDLEAREQQQQLSSPFLRSVGFSWLFLPILLTYC